MNTRSGGTLYLNGDNRVYLVQDYMQESWEKHKYIRIDLQANTLSFTLDLSNVPCGCLACVYMVAMKDPMPGSNSYV